MEQKQLDEIDETFFGEEFVDDEQDSVTIKSAKENAKHVNSKKGASSSKKKATAAAPSQRAKAAKSTKSPGKPASKGEDLKVQVVEEPPLQESSYVEPAKGPVEISSPINPWGEENESKDSFFKDTSTWKAITGITIILLIVSIFTQGFHFSGGASGSSELSLEEAQVKALDYVNTKLLQPPFVAELESSQEVNDLYLVRLSVAGQSVDSYITKDGTLFFPQGFDMTKGIEEQNSNNDAQLQQDVPAETNVDTIDTNSDADTTDSPEAAVVDAEVPDSEAGSVSDVPAAEPSAVEIKMVSRKWTFFPSKVTVKARQPVKFIITPDNSNPSFALSAFTFSIPQLGITQEVAGETVVQFTPEAAGSYPFSCSSCEDWRGMNGVLVVE